MNFVSIFVVLTLTVLGTNKNYVFSSKILSSTASSVISQEQYTPPFNQRIITDLEIIYGSHGVPVNLKLYNETQKEADNLPSVPGCPKSIDGFPWIYYGNPLRCFLADHNGPCALGQKLILRLGSPFGICVCDCLAKNENRQNLLLDPNRYLYCQDRLSEAPSGQIYDKMEKKCYNVLQKDDNGPCENGKVIAKWTNDTLTCLPLCDHNQEKWWDLRDAGVCAEPLSAGFGLSSNVLKTENCNPGEKYSDILKKCVKIQSSDASLG